MPTMIIQHKVKDFDGWRPGYEEHASRRAEYGISEVSLHRSADDPNDVVIVLRAEDLERARAFGTLPELREVMEQAGVISEPTIWLLDDA